MSTPLAATDHALKAPRAAAIAGALFSILLSSSAVLIRLAVPADPTDAGAWLSTRAGTLVLAMNPVPFSGIAAWRPARISPASPRPPAVSR